VALPTTNSAWLNCVSGTLQSKPDHAEGLYLMARSLEALDRPAEALTALERALSFYQNSLLPVVLYPLQLERIHLLRRASGPEAALSALQELVATNPDQPEMHFLLAQWANETGQQEITLQAAHTALQLGGDNLAPARRGDLHYWIGMHARQNGQLDQAIHHLSEAVDLSPDNLEAYLELGRAYQERREHRQALKIYQRAINVAGGDYRPYYYAGVALKDSKDYLAAEAMLRRASQLAPNEVSIHRLLGAVVALNLVHNRRLTPAD
jgi:tetratricopeptide (TPR) repeat protein